MEAQQIVQRIKYLGEQVLLDGGFSTVDTPQCFKNITLRPHQATAIKALMDMENARVLRVSSETHYTHLCSTGEAIIETSGLVLSEPFGSGKTIEILGLIALQPIPKAIPQHVNIITLERYKKRSGSPFCHELTKKFTGSNVLIQPNLIVVGSSVLAQWATAIEKYTNFNYLMVGNHHQLGKFYKIFQQDQAKTYDIILLKNGNVTGDLSFAGYSDNKEQHSIINIINTITAGYCWSRVVYDDFDTIRISPGSKAINTLFSIYVSATRRTTTGNETITEYNNILDALKDYQPPLCSISDDVVLFSNFNIRNSEAYIDASTKMPIVRKFRYVYKNPNDNYMRLLGAMNEEEIDNLTEMLNGDAIKTAAETMGIKTDSVADIFKRMLDKKYDQFMHDQAVLKILQNIESNILPKLAPHPKGKQHSMDKLTAIKAAITKRTMPTITYASAKLNELIFDLYDQYKQSKERNGTALDRVISNVKEGQCQICCLPLDDTDAFIVKCCGLIVCDVCGIKGNKIARRHDYKTNAFSIYGKCANCKNTIVPQQDLIFIGKDFNIQDIIKTKCGEDAQSIDTAIVPEAAEIKNPKLVALKSLIETGSAENAEIANIKLPNLVEGILDLPQTKTTVRKILLFANFTETLNLVENFLVSQKIDYMRLGGTYREIAATAEKFRTAGKVLLINSQQHCAGLNLEFCTDLIYFHKLLDRNIEGQTAGRLQRIGRTCNAHIHYLLYENEGNKA